MRNGVRGQPKGFIVALLAVLALAAYAAEIPVVPALAGEARTLEHQGVPRHYYLHNAGAAAAAPAPLVVSLHGFRRPEKALAARDDPSDTAWEALDRVADREGFVVAYPHAWLGRWNLFEGLESTVLGDGARGGRRGLHRPPGRRAS